MKKGIRSMFITLPQREAPGNQPPYGPLAVMTALEKAGHPDTELYHIDALRPDREESIQRIVDFAPDVLGISAVVSTAYENCVFYSKEIKKRLPDCVILIGGNMVSTAEVLFDYAGADFCIAGEGEIPTPQLFDWLERKGTREELKEITGLIYMEDGKMINTGYAPKIAKEDLYDINWDYFDDELTDISFPPMDSWGEGSGAFLTFFPYSDGKIENLPPRDKERLNTRMAMFFTSRGCISRCTFCHRFVKGFLQPAPDVIISRMMELKERYNVGSFYFSDECFGADKKWLKIFCEKIKPLDILWKVAGMRVDCVKPEILNMMRESGCRYIGYGFESGSPRILEVMEKRVEQEDNMNAMRWTIDAGISSIPQLVIGMPGECVETIDETIDFVSECLTLDESQNPFHVSTNYAQALPGTPLYEYARAKGIIASNIKGEEGYLLHISDKNASDASTTLNFTDAPKDVYMSWKFRVGATINYRFAQKFGNKTYYERMWGKRYRPSAIGLIRKRDWLTLRQSFPALNYYLSRVVTPVIIARTFLQEGPFKGFKSIFDCTDYLIKKSFGLQKPFVYKSLRKLLKDDIENSYCGDPMMVPLRKGR